MATSRSRSWMEAAGALCCALALARDGSRFTCPPGSRVLETGGFKGRSRELPRGELHAWLADRLGVPGRRIVNQ